MNINLECLNGIERISSLVLHFEEIRWKSKCFQSKRSLFDFVYQLNLCQLNSRRRTWCIPEELRPEASIAFVNPVSRLTFQWSWTIGSNMHSFSQFQYTHYSEYRIWSTESGYVNVLWHFPGNLWWVPTTELEQKCYNLRASSFIEGHQSKYSWKR